MNQLDNRFPKATTGFLALLLILIAVLAGYGETHATPAADPALPDPMASSNELVWVRQDPPIINVDDAPTDWKSPPNDRFTGSYGQYTITETEISYHERWVDHGVEWYDVTLKTKFDRPPLVLNPPLRYKITANASHSGTHNYGSIGYQFWYNSPYGAVIEPHEVLPYYPYADDWDGTSSKEWMINPPAILGEGDSFEMYAGWWNCYPCNITWTYKAEPANAVPYIGIKVLQPAVEYRGEEVPPGETFFPETCPPTTTHADDSCDYAAFFLKGARLTGAAAVEGRCVGRVLAKIMKIFEIYEWESESYDEDGDRRPSNLTILFTAVAIDACSPGIQSSVEATPTLELGQGAILLNNLLDGQTFNVNTPLGTAAGEGDFATGYNPDTNAAIFLTYSEPLLVEAKSGSIMVLKPNQEVELTKKGFGPVKELPHVFLPMVIR